MQLAWISMYLCELQAKSSGNEDWPVSSCSVPCTTFKGFVCLSSILELVPNGSWPFNGVCMNATLKSSNSDANLSKCAFVNSHRTQTHPGVPEKTSSSQASSSVLTDHIARKSKPTKPQKQIKRKPRLNGVTRWILRSRSCCKNSRKIWWMMKFHYTETLTPVLLMKFL